MEFGTSSDEGPEGHVDPEVSLYPVSHIQLDESQQMILMHVDGMVAEGVDTEVLQLPDPDAQYFYVQTALSAMVQHFYLDPSAMLKRKGKEAQLASSLQLR